MTTIWRNALFTIVSWTLASTAWAISLDQGSLHLDIRADNGAIDTITFAGVDYFNPGTPVSDYGFQVGTDTSTFAYNDTSGGKQITPSGAVASGSSVVASGVYSTGGANLSFTRTYTLVPGEDAVRVVTQLVNNNAAAITIRYFDTFDPDQGIAATPATYSTANDVLALGGINVVQASASNGTFVLGPSAASSGVVVTVDAFTIHTGTDLNKYYSTPLDPNGVVADAGVDIIQERTIPAGGSASLTTLLAFGLTQSAAQAAYVASLGVPGMPPGLVSWYQAEGNVTDTIGNNPGTAQGSLAYAPGVVGEGFSSAGNGYVSVASPTLNSYVGGFSVAGWFVITNYTGYSSFFNLRNGSNNSGFTVEQDIGTPGNMKFTVIKANGTAGVLASSGWALNTPYFIAATFDGASGKMCVYRNGALIASRTDAAGNMATTPGPSLNIGRNLISADVWNGLIDEVQVYDHALTAADAASLANPAPGLISWYRAENNTLDTQGLNNGNAQGTLSYAPGVLGQGFALGNSGFVDIPSPSLNANANAFTINAWIVLDSYAGNASLLNFRDSNNNSGFTLEQGGGIAGNINFNVFGGGSLASTGWSLHTPYYITATFDGIAGNLSIYRNGVLIASQNVTPNPMTTVGAPVLQIGRNIITGETWRGEIDEVRFYHGALTPAAVAALAVYNLYTITDLGTLGGSGSAAFSLNNSGQLVGYSYTVGTSVYHAALFHPGSAPTDLGTLGGTNSAAYGINNAGQIVGDAYTSGSSANHAALFSTGGLATDLGTLGGTNSTASGINDAGQIVGSAGTSGASVTHAALFRIGNSPGDLGTFGGTYSFAYSVNASGQVCGSANLSGDSVGHAALYNAASVGGSPTTDLGSLGGNSKAYSINSAGQTAGYSYLSGNSVYHAVMFNIGSSPTDLGTLGGTNSVVNSLNNIGQAVGSSDTIGNAGNDGFLYAAANGMRDLNSLVGLTPAATGINIAGTGTEINDWGQIAASGTVTGGVQHALLLNPITPNSSVSGSAQDIRLVAGSSYSLTPVFTNTKGFLTTVRLLDGTVGGGGVSTYGQNRDVTETFTTNPATPLASDAVNLQGAAADPVVVQLSYSESSAVTLFGKEGNARLGWYDGKHWVNAVDGDTGGVALLVGDRAYNAVTDFHLGTYGIDSVNNVVWAVVNHGGLFGVTLDPNVLKTVRSVSRSGTQITVTVDSFTGHVYKLQRATALTGGAGFVAADASQQSGSTGTTLSFTHDDGTATQAFYRLLIDP